VRACVSVVIQDFAAACSRNPNKTIIRIASHANLADTRSALSGNEKVRFVYTTGQVSHEMCGVRSLHLKQNDLDFTQAQLSHALCSPVCSSS